jgi:cyclopropane fatty-acyl-phospholipid synthase-like methyltransferase
MQTALGTDLNALAAPPGTESEPQDVHAAYDGSNVLFRLLRMITWGPGLMNLGYFRFRGPFAFLNLIVNLEKTQRRLVEESLRLLEVGQRHSVLDVACGRGKSSFMAHCLHPQSSIIGLDLLEPNIEAAFHFPDRSRFLSEACRVLKPGGRLVVIDFAWRTAADRQCVDDRETRIVRDIWQWSDLYDVDEYRTTAEVAGLRQVKAVDWSSRVTAPFQATFDCLLALARRPRMKKRLLRNNPLLKSLTDDDWNQLAEISKAQDYVRRRSRYMAFVFEKAA